MAYKARELLIVNKSTCIPNNVLAAYVLAIQRQVNEHFGPVWGLFATLRLGPETDLRPGMGVVYFIDNPPADDKELEGILGYHDVTARGDPIAYVFAKLDKAHNLCPSVTFSHEVLEMLADVSTTWCTLVGDTLYSIEVCDAVEDDDEGYDIDGVRVSNFVYPEWFDPRNVGKRLDHLGRCRKPLEIRPGGYMSVFTIGKDDEWRNITGPKGAHRLEVKKASRPSFTRSAIRNRMLKEAIR